MWIKNEDQDWINLALAKAVYVHGDENDPEKLAVYADTGSLVCLISSHACEHDAYFAMDALMDIVVGADKKEKGGD